MFTEINQKTQLLYTEAISDMLGRVLTIVDASIQDPEQRKAVKDLMRSAVWSGRFPTTFAEELSRIYDTYNKDNLTGEKKPYWYVESPTVPVV